MTLHRFTRVTHGLSGALLALASLNCSGSDDPQDDGTSNGGASGAGGSSGSAGSGGGSGGASGASGSGTGGSSPGGSAGTGSGGSAGTGSGGDAGAGPGGSSGAAGAAGVGGSSGGGGILPPVDDVGGNGPFTTTIDKNTGPSRSAWVARPTELGQGGLKHPVFLWGPGASTTPMTYEAYLVHWASQGFVVYSIVSTGDGAEMKAAIDWLIAENGRSGSPYFEKLDPARIAAGGHSRGSLSSFGAGDDPRLVTTIHVAGGSMTGTGSANLHAPAAYICGETDTLATPNCERDYTATTVPVFFTVMSGVDHFRAANVGKPAITAWLRWHIAGETERRAMFLDPSCTFCSGIWVSKSKNW